jgi:hypothetical protein
MMQYRICRLTLDGEGGMKVVDTLQKEAIVVIHAERQQPDPKKGKILAC